VEVEFDLRLEDLHAFVRFQKERERAEWRRQAGLAWFGFGIIVLLVLIVPVLIGVWAVWVGLLLGVVLSSFGWLLVVARLQKVYLLFPEEHFNDPRNQWAWITRRVTLSPEEVVTTSRLFRGATRWETVWDVGVAPDHLFLMTSTKECVAIPRRAFRDRQHFEEFVALARRYKEGAPTSTAITASLPGETQPRPTTVTRALE
jgi:hypothetical protein